MNKDEKRKAVELSRKKKEDNRQKFISFRPNPDLLRLQKMRNSNHIMIIIISAFWDGSPFSKLVFKGSSVRKVNAYIVTLNLEKIIEYTRRLQ